MSDFNLMSGPSDPKVWLFTADRNMTLREAQGKVGGYVEMVRTGIDGHFMLIDEDGLLKGLERNDLASQHAGRPIVGDVVVVKPRSGDGWLD